MPLKNPVIFTILVVIIVSGAAVATYFYGLPLLQSEKLACWYGGGTRIFGCSTSFGKFMVLVSIVTGFAIGAIWTKFGR